MTTSPRFWNWMAHRYSRQPIANEEAYRHKLDVTQTLLRSEMNVLEFGCGTGSTALIHSPFVAHIDAIDFSEKMINIAKGKAAAQGVGNVAFRTATIEDWQAKDHSYDVVLGLSILHLVEDKQAVLTKVHRLLKPGGTFISSTVCMAELKGVLRWILPVGNALGVLPLVQTFSLEELMESMQRAGFLIESNWRPEAESSAFIVAKAAAP